MVQKTAFILAGEYFTAQKQVGKPEVLSNFRDENTVYTELLRLRNMWVSVTAQEHDGKTEVRSNFRDKNNV